MAAVAALLVIAQGIGARLNAMVDFQRAVHGEGEYDAHGAAKGEIIIFLIAPQPACGFHALIGGCYQVAVDKEIFQHIRHRLQNKKIKPQQRFIALERCNLEPSPSA